MKSIFRKFFGRQHDIVGVYEKSASVSTMALSIELSFEDIEKDVGQHLNAGKSRDKWNAVKEAVMAGGQENIKKTIDDFEEHLTGLLPLGKRHYDLKTKHPIYWLARENLLKFDHQNSHDKSDVSATKSNEPTRQMPSLSDLQKKIDNVMDKLQLEKRRPDARSTADDVDECVLKLNAIIEAVQGIPRRYEDLHFLLQESLMIKRLISPESTENQELPENPTIDEKLNLLKRTTSEIFETIDAKSYHYKKIDPKILENRRDDRQMKDELKPSKPNKEVLNIGERQDTGMPRQEIAMLQDKERSLTVALQRMEADKNYWMNSDLQKKIDNVMDKLQLEKRRPDARSTADDVDECVLKLNAIIEAVQGIPRRYEDLHFLLQESLMIKRLISPESTENQELPENPTIDEKLNLLKRTTSEIFETIDAKSYHYKKIDPKILENRFDSANIGRKTGFKLVWTAVSLVEDRECRGFLCEGSEQCGDSRYVCKDSSTKYCIDQSLYCNNVPNCGALDNSDEDKCLSKVLWIVLYTVVPIVIIVIIVIWAVFCYKRHKRKKLYIEKKEAQRNQQTHWVSPHIRSLEHSPNPGRANTMLTTSFISSKHSSELDFIGKTKTDLDYNDKNTLDLDYQDSPVKENKLNEKTKAEKLINTFADDSPKKVVLHSPSNDSNKVEDENKLTVPCLKNKIKDEEPRVQFELDTIPNFRSHQKRSSYHLMQELNLGESEVMIAKI